MPNDRRQSRGKVDLICLNIIDGLDFTVITYLGNGDGTFQSGISSATLTDANGIYVIWLSQPADFNGDQIPDVAISVFDETGDGEGSTQFFLLGDGTGHFNLSATMAIPSGPGIFDFTTADVNGDGKPDLLERVGPWVFLGNGNGTFQQGQPQSSFDSCLFRDMDGDGHLDAVCGALLNTEGSIGGGDVSGATELAILHGNADGTFNPTPIYKKTFGNPVGGYADYEYPQLLADVNGDGLLDLLAFSQNGLSVLLGQSGPGFGNPIAHYSVGFLGATSSMSTAYADMNGDGAIDIVCAGPDGIYISYGKPDGTFAAPTVFEGAQQINYATVADFNGDGVPDILAVGGGVLSLNLGKGDGTFQPYTVLDTGEVQFENFPPTHGDFLGNGKQDVLAFAMNSQTDGLFMMEGNGNGTFAAPELLANPPLPPTLDTPISVVDINGDGRDDIAYTSNNNQTGVQSITVGISNGDGTFTTVNSSVPGSTFSLGATALAFADFNGDGKLDAAYGDDGVVDVLAGNGAGSFDFSGTALPLPEVQGQAPAAVAAVVAGDFDGDGKSDLAVLDQISSTQVNESGQGVPATILSAVLIYYGNGDGTFSRPTVAATSTQPYAAMYASDVNRDGRLDLLLATDAIGTISLATSGGSGIGLLLNAGNRLFDPEREYTPGLAVQIPLGIADLNGDGYPDLVAVGSAQGNGITPLLNLGPTSPSTGVATSTTLNTSSGSAAAGTSVTFTATVSTKTAGKPTPTGSVLFTDQTGVTFTAQLTPVNATSAVATFTTSAIGIGEDTMGAFYSGDTVFAPSSATVTETVAGASAAVSVTASPSPANIQQNVTFTVSVTNAPGSSAPLPRGVVYLSDGGNPLFYPLTLTNGSVSFQTSFLLPGVHPLTVDYSGDGDHIAATGTLNLIVLEQPNVAISLSANTIIVNQAVSATVSVQPQFGGPTPTGTVVLAGDGFTSTAVSLANAVATFNISASTLAVGNDILTATYTPDAASSSDYVGATGSQPIEVAAIPPSFSLSGSSITISAGATTGNTSTITVTPANGFTGAVNLSCSLTNSPIGAIDLPSCSVSSSITISGDAAAAATLTVGTTAPTSASLDFRRFMFGKGGAVLAILVLFGIPGRRRGWRLGLAVLGILIFSFAMTACGGGGGSGGGVGQANPGTTPGAYTITVKAEDAATATITASTAVTVNVN